MPLHVVNMVFDHVFWRDKGHVQISPQHHLLMSQAEAFEIHLLMASFLCVWDCVSSAWSSDHIVQSMYKCAPNALPFWIAAQAVWANHHHPFALAVSPGSSFCLCCFDHWMVKMGMCHCMLSIWCFDHVFWRDKGTCTN